MKKTRSPRIAAALLGVTLVCSLLTSVQGQTAKAPLKEAQRLEQEADQKYQAGRLDEATVLLERALALREKVQSQESIAVIETVNNLAQLYFAKEAYHRAEPLFVRVLAAYEKNPRTKSDQIALASGFLGLVYYHQVDYARALPLLQRTLTLWEKALGPEHPDVAFALNNVGLLYIATGEYPRAQPLLQRALTIREKTLGPEHPDVAQSLNNLALLYKDQGDYARAAPLYQRALTIWEKVSGPEHPDVAVAVNNLARLYRDQGDYARAAPLFQRALTIWEKALGPEHPLVAVPLNGLAFLYEDQGDYAQALPLYQRALTIREKALGPEHPEVATSLNSLAGLYETTGDFAQAEPLHQRALTILEKALGKEHPNVALSLYNLASLYQTTGDYTQAEPLLQRSLAILEKVYGPEHPAVATALNNLAVLYRATGDYAQAEPLYQRSLAIYEKALGKEHPDVAVSLNNLAVLYQATGDYGQAISFRQRGSEVEEKNIALILDTGSQQQKQLYLNTLSGETAATVSLHAQDVPNNNAAARLAVTTILRRKGRALDAFTGQLEALRRRANPADKKLLDDLAAVQSQLANLQLGGGNLAPEARRAEVARLTAAQERLEDAIGRRSAEFRAVTLPVTLQAVQQALPAEAALIEFFVYQPFNPKAKPGEQYLAPRYVAYLLKRDSAAPLFVELGQAAALDGLLKQWRAALLNPKSADVKALGRAVDAQVMQPVRKLLGDTKRLFISPDSALNLVPFAALVDENDKFLVETYSLNYLTSGRDLLRLQIPPDQKPDAPVILANPQFDLTRPVVTCRAAQRGLGLPADAPEFRGLDFTQYCYPTLDGTAQEAARLSALLPQATTWTQQEATEATLKTLRRPSVLHIATHGFFLPDQPPPAPNAARQLSLGLDNPAAAAGPLRENPLLRSGLILAGVKQRQSGPDNDGVLTALEAAGLNLFGTKLVVLSACETGLGEVANGQGVYGLRRALVLAGSETQVMSLWKVADTATAALMTSYYTRLQRGEGRSEAMRQVQLELLKNGKLAQPVGETRKIEQEGEKGKAGPADWRHPYYWASFIQSGAWTNLDGK